jgi:hypothetical protein
MKVSSLTSQIVADYLKVDWYSLDNTQQAEIDMILDAAKAYVESFTGQALEALDDYPDVTIAVLVLCQDMYDNRTMYVDNANVNRVVENILGMHSVNLL